MSLARLKRLTQKKAHLGTEVKFPRILPVIMTDLQSMRIMDLNNWEWGIENGNFWNLSRLTISVLFICDRQWGHGWRNWPQQMLQITMISGCKCHIDSSISQGTLIISKACNRRQVLTGEEVDHKVIPGHVEGPGEDAPQDGVGGQVGVDRELPRLLSPRGRVQPLGPHPHRVAVVLEERGRHRFPG